MSGIHITVPEAILQAGEIYLLTFVISFFVAVLIKLIYKSVRLFHTEQQQ